MIRTIRKWLGKLGFFFNKLLYKMGIGMRGKLIIIFLVAKVVPLILLTVIAWQQFSVLGSVLREIAVEDSSKALNDSAVENIERMTTDTASRVAEFLYGRDDDILYLAQLPPSEAAYNTFIERAMGKIIDRGQWVLAEDGLSWERIPTEQELEQNKLDEQYRATGVSTNTENEDREGFHYRGPDEFSYTMYPLYEEIAFIDLNGMEQVKVIAPYSTKTNYPMDAQKKDVSIKQNTYIKAEDYFEKLKSLKPGEIYVSDVIGAYTPSNYIGMYTPQIVANAALDKGYDIEYAPNEQAYAGQENPNGQRFEGIVRWATPVTDESGEIIGYVSFALNHDHIMEFVDHLTPMIERYTQVPSAFEGNYAFIWDYKCRSICHPRHHSIVGYNPQTGEPEIPWLETSIFNAWQESGIEKWTDYVKHITEFDNQSRSKPPAPALTQLGLVGLDGRYLNNAPQCTGWMDLTQEGGSGSFYILWSGLYKLTTAGAIPYYTGQYAPSEDNNYSRRGFGIVTIGAGLEDFTRPATETEAKLNVAIDENMQSTFLKLLIVSIIIIILVVLIAILIASSLTGNIKNLIKGISRFKAGERQFRFNPVIKDEFGTLADSFDEMADSIVNSVKNPLSITDMQRNIIYMNQQGLDYCHANLSDIVGKPYSDTSVYPADSEYDPILALEQGREAEILFVKDTGRYLQGVANYFLNNEGEKVGYIIESRDVTDMVQEQIKLEEQRTLLDKIFSASPDLIWYIDADGKYLVVNPRFADITGKTPEEIIGKTAKDVLPGDIAKGFIKNDQKAMQEKAPLYIEEHIAFADDHKEILDSVRMPIYDVNGMLMGMLGYGRNVTSRVKIESELRNTQIELEEAVNEANKANEHKGEFLARMSHEIRTPMNAIIGLTNIIQKKLGDIDGGRHNPEMAASIGEIEGRIRQIEASSQHLLGLLNDILDISKIEAGKIELSEETVELPKLINTVGTMIKPRCDEKNIKYVTEYDGFEPCIFKLDPLRLRQVLINLLGNAVKFTPEFGEIRLIIKRMDRKEGRTLVHFAVRDTGIGISESAMKAIFEPFEQGGSNVSKQYGGTGLGLAISRRIIELFGDEIRVNSELDKGSEFSFSIWLTETDEAVIDREAIFDVTGKFAGKRALLVDDVAINRMIVASLLEGTGIEIDEAGDGQEAVNKFKDSVQNYYDIILMDVQMPRMDGYEASSIIRAMDRADAKSVPIVALTANAFKEDMDKALKYGMNAHVAKPIEAETLLEVMLKYL